jgi:hypothetical protein
MIVVIAVDGLTPSHVTVFATLLAVLIGTLGFPIGDERLVLLRLKALEWGAFSAWVFLMLAASADRLRGLTEFARYNTGENFFAVMCVSALGCYLVAMVKDGRNE